MLGFLGPNGAGKTTLFDVLSGLLSRATAATCCSTASSIAKLGPDARARARPRAFVPGRSAVPRAHRRARRSRSRSNAASRCAIPIAAALHLPSVADSEAKVRARVEELIELLGLGAFRDKYVRELSTGSRRVVDLACVLAHKPRVLLLDEPSSGIAQREAEALGPLLLRIRAMTGASLLIIEHDVPLLTSIADRMIALDLGEVVAVGTPPRSSAIPGWLRRTWENPKQSLLAAVPAARCPDRGKHMAASSGGAANGGGTPKSGGTSSGGKLLRRYGPIALVDHRDRRRDRVRRESRR